MELVGRLTADATIKKVKDGREVVSFSVAVNDRFKSKETVAVKETVVFVNCSYGANSLKKIFRALQ